MRPTYHLVPEATWTAADRSPPYAAASLADEGFIHCTDGVDELIATANRHYRSDPRAFVAVTLDLDLVGSPWTVEDERGIYPHVHGPIDQAAIGAVNTVERDDTGTFLGLGPAVPAVHGPGSAG